MQTVRRPNASPCQGHGRWAQGIREQDVPGGQFAKSTLREVAGEDLSHLAVPDQANRVLSHSRRPPGALRNEYLAAHQLARGPQQGRAFNAQATVQRFDIEFDSERPCRMFNVQL